MTRLVQFAALLLALATTAHANVIGFDFGSTFFKITLVQPGQPFNIVENTSSKRKTDSMMSITPEARLWGVDAFVGAGRYPKTTFQDAASLLAVDFDQ